MLSRRTLSNYVEEISDNNYLESYNFLADMHNLFHQLVNKSVKINWDFLLVCLSNNTVALNDTNDQDQNDSDNFVH